MDLDSGAVEGGIARRRGAVEYENWQISQRGISSVIETDLVLRQDQLVGDSNHDKAGDEG